MSATDSKRIAKNTAFLYFRMILVMAVTLYTSRIVLEELGVNDYGIYTVVGGVIAMFSFLNNSMVSSTQRFLNYELGKGKDGRVKEVFSTSLAIHLAILLIVLVLAETVGLWFVNTQLVIPPDRMTATNIVYQAAILSFGVTIMQIPFNSAIIANEKMNVYAYISIIEVLLKLSIALSLLALPDHKLAWYGILIFAVHLIVATIYAIYSLRTYPECTLKIRFIKNIFKDMCGFAGWNLMGSIAWLIRGQGLGIILNLFFGPVINAAKGISDQVQGAVNQFNSNFQMAMNPQITKNYAGNALADMERLAYRGIKLSSILLLALILPIALNVSTILNIWLTVVPGYTQIFIILVLIDLLVGNLFGQPLITSLMATGNIRQYQIVVSIILLLILPVSYLMLKAGMIPESIFYANIALNFLAGIVRLSFCVRQIGYHYYTYFRYVLMPVIITTLLTSGIMITLKLLYFDADTFINLIILTLISIICVGSTAWFITLDKTERSFVKDIVRNKLKRGK